MRYSVEQRRTPTHLTHFLSENSETFPDVFFSKRHTLGIYSSNYFSGTCNVTSEENQEP